MLFKFLVAGVNLRSHRLPDGSEIIPYGQMKSQARRASHLVPGADDKVGPVVRFERYGRIHERPLTRREIIFGVKAPDDGKGGGWKGTVAWRDPDSPEGVGEVLVDLYRSRMGGFRSEEETIQFVRQIILAAGWTIIIKEG